MVTTLEWILVSHFWGLWSKSGHCPMVSSPMPCLRWGLIRIPVLCSFEKHQCPCKFGKGTYLWLRNGISLFRSRNPENDEGIDFCTKINHELCFSICAVKGSIEQNKIDFKRTWMCLSSLLTCRRSSNTSALSLQLKCTHIQEWQDTVWV